jgi:hypothetical protein
MLTHKRLLEVITTDTNFSNEKLIEGNICTNVYFGMTSKRLYVIGMKTDT